jgi:hypothetical protein
MGAGVINPDHNGVHFYDFSSISPFSAHAFVKFARILGEENQKNCEQKVFFCASVFDALLYMMCYGFLHCQLFPSPNETI